MIGVARELQGGTTLDRWTHAVSWIYLVMLGIFAIHTGTEALREHFTVPVSDDWLILHDLHFRPLFDWIFEDRNGHRIPLSYLFVALDYQLLDGEMRLLVGSSLILAIGSAYPLLTAMRRDANWGMPAERVLFGFAVYTLFWSGGVFHFVWGIAQCNLLAAFFFLLAIAQLTIALDPRDTGSGSATFWRITRVGVFAALATMSQGAGFASWPSLLAICVVARAPWRVTGGLGLAAVVTIGTYSATLDHTAIYRMGLTSVFGERIAEMAQTSVAFVGFAAARTAIGLDLADPTELQAWSTAAGTLGLLVFGGYAFALLRAPDSVRASDFVAVGFMTFAIAIGLVITAVRLPFLGAPVVLGPRFATWSAFFWAGVFIAVSRSLSRFAGRAAQAIVVTGVLGVSLSMLPALEQARVAHHKGLDRAEQTKLALLLGVPGAGKWLYSKKRDVIEKVARRHARDGKSPYSDPRRALPGSRFRDHFALDTRRRCRGAFDVLEDHPEDGAVSVAGSSEVDGQPLSRQSHVVVTSSDGTIRGLGSFRRSAVGDASGRSWFGLIADFDPSERYIAYAILGSGGAACALERVAADSTSTRSKLR